ncbi:FtsX-like permease family protein, partial [Listeria monocytogenes]|nr:FtsX-like permease family protein [Listeria monocytogenes]
MNNNKFVFWNFWKNYKKTSKQWLSTGVVTFCGLLLINVTILIVFIGNTYINVNFTENNSLKWIEVQSDGPSIPLRQISRNRDNTITLLPKYEPFMSGVTFENYDEKGNIKMSMDVNSIFVPYESLEFFGINIKDIDKIQWDEGKVILVSPIDAKSNGLLDGQKLSVPFDKTAFNNEFDLSDTELEDYIAKINENKIEVTVKIREITTLPQYENYSLLPIQLLVNQHSKVNSISEDEFISNAKLTDGFYIIVKKFEDVDKIANEYKARGYSLKYALESFQNLSEILSNVKLVSNYFIILVSIIISITFINNCSQILYHRKHEIGLQQALGISKRSLIWSTLIEFVFQSIIVMIIILPTIIFEWFVVKSMLTNNIVEINGLETVLVVWGINWIIILAISLIGATFPLMGT